ncbi:MAG TPA: peptidylprolyl isomerase [Oscillatoriaceae cyanobacterium]
MLKPLVTLTCLLALAVPAIADPASQTATATATPANAASIADQEAAAGKVLFLGPRLTFETDHGSFTLVTFPQEAPQTVAQIVKLARGGFYDGLAFHRIVPGFVAQVGDPATRHYPPSDPHVGNGGSGHPVPPEYDGQSVQFLTGTVGLARGQAPNSGDSQFFVTLAPEPNLNDRYTIFGQVIRGMDTVRALKVGDRIRHVSVTEPIKASPSP